MKTITKTLGCVLACLCAATFALSAQTPQKVVDAFVAKVEKTALQTNFAITITERATEPMSYRGQIQMLGSQFHLKMDGVEVFYNGQTQWTYQAEIEEINLAEPSAEELAENNPMLLIKALKSTCKLHFSDTDKDATAYVVDFYPQNKMSNVLKLTFKLRKSDYMPLSIVQKETQGKTTTLKFSNQKFGIQTNSSIFTLDESNYPNAIINDLR